MSTTRDISTTDILDHLRGGGTVAIDHEGVYYGGHHYERASVDAYLAAHGEHLSDRTSDSRCGLAVAS